MREANLRAFPDRAALAEALAETIAADLADGIAERGAAALAVSGGTTPVRFFEALSRRALDWSRVTVTLVDERWVPETSERSNARLVREHLLKDRAADATFLPLFNGPDSPETALPSIEARLAALPRPFDAVVLGMGADGHTASFFPGGDNLALALSNRDRIVVPMRAPGAGEPRVTLTLETLLEARALYLHIEGEEKRRVLERALAPGPTEDMPVRAVLRQARAPVTLFWAF